MTRKFIKPVGIVGIRALVRVSDNLTDIYCTFICKLKSKSEPIITQLDELQDAKWIPLEKINDPEIVDFTRLMVMKALNCKPMTLDNESEELAKSRSSSKTSCVDYIAIFNDSYTQSKNMALLHERSNLFF